MNHVDMHNQKTSASIRFQATATVDPSTNTDQIPHPSPEFLLYAATRLEANILNRGNTASANAEPDNGNVGVYFAGNLCLESDLVYRHMTYLQKMPEPGDLVVFPNSAGYFMDFSASTSIMQPVA